MIPPTAIPSPTSAASRMSWPSTSAWSGPASFDSARSDPGPPDLAVATRRAASAWVAIATVTRINKIPTSAPKAPKSSGPRTRAATMLSRKAAPLPTRVATPTRIKPLASAERDSCSTGVTLLAGSRELSVWQRPQIALVAIQALWASGGEYPADAGEASTPP